MIYSSNKFGNCAFLLVLFVSFLSWSPHSLAETKKPAKKVSKSETKKPVAGQKPVAKKSTPTPAPKVVSKAPASAQRNLSSVSDSNSALEVRGQSRNLSMLLVLKNRKDNVNFVKPREHYSTEIQNTSY